MVIYFLFCKQYLKKKKKERKCWTKGLLLASWHIYHQSSLFSRKYCVIQHQFLVSLININSKRTGTHTQFKYPRYFGYFYKIIQRRADYLSLDNSNAHLPETLIIRLSYLYFPNIFIWLQVYTLLCKRLITVTTFLRNVS